MNVGRPNKPKDDIDSDGRSAAHRTRPTQWMELVGDIFMEAFPGTKLPTNSVVILRYHTLKLNMPSVTSPHTYAATIHCDMEQCLYAIVPDEVSVWNGSRLSWIRGAMRLQEVKSGYHSMGCNAMLSIMRFSSTRGKIHPNSEGIKVVDMAGRLLLLLEHAVPSTDWVHG